MNFRVLCLSLLFAVAQCNSDEGRATSAGNKKRQDEFDWKLMKTLMKSSDKNLIVSPLSVKILLTLLAEASGQEVKSQTFQELSNVLPEHGKLKDAKDYYKYLLDSVETQDKNYILDIATRIYLDSFIEPNQRFTSIAEVFYKTHTECLEFSDARESAQRINSWVSEATYGHVKELVDEASVSQAVILMLNAIYFKGTWRNVFLQNETVIDNFKVTSRKSVRAPFMHQTGQFYFTNSDKLDAKILRLQYRGHRFSLFIVLPNRVDGINDLINSLESETLNEDVFYMDKSEVKVVIPKFKFDTQTDMNDAIQQLGIRQIFTNEASLPLLARAGASAGRLKVSKIIQKAGLVVDERGSSAYATTELQLEDKWGGKEEFIANHPFVFYIEDETTGAILFAGRVSNPNEV